MSNRDELEKSIKIFEDNYDICILPNIYIVARLDGRSFSSLTKKMNLQKPFDDTFNQVMSSIVEGIMKDSGYNIVYGYHQSDEISFLFKFGVDTFNRRINKYISTLSSLASSIFTFHTKEIVSFDCRISHLPTIDNVIDYFHWRQKDAARNALHGYCYWKLREKFSVKTVVNLLNKKSQNDKQEILFESGINYNDVTNWHKRGIGFYWVKESKLGINPLTKEEILVDRNKLYKDLNLTYGENYSLFLRNLNIKEREN